MPIYFPDPFYLENQHPTTATATYFFWIQAFLAFNSLYCMTVSKENPPFIQTPAKIYRLEISERRIIFSLCALYGELRQSPRINKLSWLLLCEHLYTQIHRIHTFTMFYVQMYSVHIWKYIRPIRNEISAVPHHFQSRGNCAGAPSCFKQKIWHKWLRGIQESSDQ